MEYKKFIYNKWDNILLFLENFFGALSNFFNKHRKIFEEKYWDTIHPMSFTKNNSGF